MLVGIGTDIVELRRIKASVERTERFTKKIFTDREYEAYVAEGSRIERVAGTFAAKEAVSKALGTGFRTFEMQDIEIVRDVKGKPCVQLYNGAKDCLDAIKGKQILISISHSQDYAVAMVTIEGCD